MAPDRHGASPQHHTPLKAITQRISSTPTKQLPTAVPQLVNLLVDCRQSLSCPEDSRAKQNLDTATIHKFRTQVTTLLNDRSIEGRWAAAIFIKTSIDVGGYETLHRCGPWVRGLLANLNKADPPTSKKLYAITLTRIFTLTHEYPTLVREITTPSLSPFITSCLNIMSPKGTSKDKAGHSLIISMLECLRCLLPHHPSVFRSFVAQLKTKLVTFMSNISSDLHEHSKSIHTSAQLIESAQALFALLPYCAPKQTSGEEWCKTADLIIVECHKIADKIFRSVYEDRDVVPGSYNSTAAASVITQDIQQSSQESALGLQGWTGIHSGADNIRMLLKLLLQLVQSQSANSISFATGNFLDILYRVLSICPPAKADSKVARGFGYNARFNDAISREEREGLFSELPSLHTVALEVLQALCERLGPLCMPILQSTLDLVVWVCSCEHFNPSIRTASFALVSKILGTIGPSLTKLQVRHLEGLVRSCCEELLPTSSDTISSTTEARLNGKVITADSFLQNLKTISSKSGRTSIKSASERAAAELLITYLSHVPSVHISPRLRAQLDRTAIFTSAADAMTASVLNSGPSAPHGSKPNSSILPFLARAYPEHMATEALIKPRLPVILSGLPEEQKENSGVEHYDNSDEDQNMLNVTQPTTWTSAFATNPPQDETSSDQEQQTTRAVLEVNPNELVPMSTRPLNMRTGASKQEPRNDSESFKRQRTNAESDTASPAKRRHIDEQELDPRPQPRVDSPSASTTREILTDQPAMTATPTTSENYDAVGQTDLASAPVNATPGTSATHLNSLNAMEASEDEEDFEIPTLTMDSDDDDDLEDA